MAPWVPEPNPHPQLQTMRRLVEDAKGTDKNVHYTTLKKYLTEASHEEWQLTLHHLYSTCLALVEWKVFHLTARLNHLGNVLGFDVTQALALHNEAFSYIPSPANVVSFDATNRAVSRTMLMQRVVEGIILLERKRGYSGTCNKMLADYELVAKERGLEI